jgi:hypothetical protein
MGDAALLLRIRVVIGSTRAAAKSLGADDAQRAAVLERGRRLLDAFAAEVDRDGSDAVRKRFARATEELSELGES